MSIDTFMRIGSTHNICQDYVIHKGNSIALSDGCSSAPDTDIGARLICHAKLAGEEEALPDIVAKLGLVQACLCGTYLSLTKDKDDFLYERWGDGCIIRCYDDGEICIDEMRYSANAPYYIGYRLCGMDKAFDSLQSNFASVKHYEFLKDFTFDTELSFTTEDVGDKEFKSSIGRDQIRWLAITSDGLSSFVNKDQEPIGIPQLVPYLFSFKNFHGEFVKRRMQMAFREFDKLGWKNTDDISIGVIHNE